MRRGHGGAPGQPADARGRLASDHGAGEPRAPRGQRRGPADRRRRGDPHADARRAAARRRRLRPAAARLIRGADVLPADRRRRAREPGAAARAHRAGRGPALARLARRARRPQPGRRGRRRVPAGDPPAVRRRGSRARAQRPGRLRAQAVRDPARRRAQRRAPRAVRHVELIAHDQLQGHADQLPAGGLLSRPARRAHQERARARALALLHEHVPQLGARAPLPGDLPQRRDQHRARQHQLDARARERAAQRAVRRRPGEDPARRQPRQLGLGDVRQRARAADARRALAAARGDDDDPRGLPQAPGPVGGSEGLLRLSLVPDGAVGRAGLGGVHRRARRRRDARPQRPASRALGGDDRRARRARLGDRAAGHRARADPQARAPAAGKAVPRRPRGRAHRRGRGGQARRVHAQALPRVVRAQRRAVLRARSLRPGDDLRPAAAHPPARVRLLPRGSAHAAGADGARRRRAGRLDGQRPVAGGALRAGAAAVLLLQAAVRAGHQPADRPDPRGNRDEPGDDARLGAEPVRGDARARAQARARPADPAQPPAGDAAPRPPRRVRRAHDQHDLVAAGGCRRA